MVEVGKFGDKTIVIDSRYLSVFKAGKLLKKYKYMIYLLPDGYVYLYRRPITITEKSGEDLTDYQVRIVISGDDPIWQHARSAGEDIRFCRYAEEQMLPYWIEKYDPINKEAIIWVKVPSIPANSTINIFMYYGNPEVASASDGEATFEFFDDFEDGDVSDWAVGGVNADAVWEASQTKVRRGNYAARMYIPGNVSGWDIYAYKPTNLGSEKLAYEVDFIMTNTEGGAASNIDFDIGSVNNDRGEIRYGYYEGGSTTQFFINYKNTAGEITTVYAGSFSENVWFKLTIIRIPPNTVKFLVDDELLHEATDVVDFTPLYIGALGGGGTSEAFFDDFRIRKYTEPEPSVSVGAEE